VIIGWKLPQTILWPTGEVQRGPRRNPVETVGKAVENDTTMEITNNEV